MADDDALRRDLLWRIEARRASIQAYLREHRPRTRRRATITIVLSSLAALFTAGPALGGEPFAQSVQNSLGLASDSYVWRTLCLLTLLVSIASAILVNLGKANDEVAQAEQRRGGEHRAGGADRAPAVRPRVPRGRRQALPAVHREDPVRRRPADRRAAGAVAGAVRAAATCARPVRAPASPGQYPPPHAPVPAAAV